MSPEVEPIAYDRATLGVGIVHIGVGNFHRSHQAMYLDRLARRGLADGWGICGVGVLPGDVALLGALRSQDGEYTLVEQDPGGERRALRIGSRSRASESRWRKSRSCTVSGSTAMQAAA